MREEKEIPRFPFFSKLFPRRKEAEKKEFPPSFSSTETRWNLGNSRLYFSATFGNDFAMLLEQEEPIFSPLSDKVLAAQEALKSPRPPKTIVLPDLNQAASFLRTINPPEIIIGARVGKEYPDYPDVGRAETADQIFRLMMYQAGHPPSADRVLLWFIENLLFGREKKSIVLIIGFDNLSKKEQDKLKKILGKGVFGRVLKIYVNTKSETESTTCT